MGETQTGTAVTTWSIDPAHSQMGFRVKHMMIATVRGRFADVAGTIRVDEEEPTRSEVEVEIDAASVDTRNADRDTHLRSADFFDAESHPKLVFRGRRVEGLTLEPGSSFRIVGDLTIRGVTREVVLEAEYGGRGPDPWGGERIAFSASAELDRRDYDLEWNQVIEAGNVLVSDDVKVELEVEAVLQGDETA